MTLNPIVSESISGAGVLNTYNKIRNFRKKNRVMPVCFHKLWKYSRRFVILYERCHLDWSTYFIWRNDIIISSVTSQFPEKYFRQNESCKMSSEYVEIKYISYTTVLWFSKKFILLFVPESFGMIILSYPFSKVLFSPTFLHRFSFRKKTGGLAEHDFVLYLQNVYFPT